MTIEMPKVGAHVFKAATELRDIEKITPYIRNPMKHSRDSIDKLAGAIAEWGFDVPIVVDGQGVIIKGHRRRLAALKLGMKEVPVIVRTDLTPEQVKAARIADNQLPDDNWDIELLAVEMRDLRLADFDLKLTGFDEAELAQLGLEDPPPDETDADAIPEKVETRCKPGDLWQLGAHRLLCGDSTKAEDVARLMGGEKADMVFTDPPYGVSYADKNRFLNRVGLANRIEEPILGDHAPVADMKVIWDGFLATTAAACHDKASYYICSPQVGELMMMMMIAISDSPWQLKHTIIWVKNNHVLGRCDYHYKHEPILYGWKKKGTHEFIGAGRCGTSVWDFNKPLKNDLHPTMKPVELVEEALANSCKNGGLVLDTFLGSGTTLIACERTKRRCFGAELSPSYCDVVLKRWEDATGQKATLIESTPPVQNDLPSTPA